MTDPGPRPTDPAAHQPPVTTIEPLPEMPTPPEPHRPTGTARRINRDLRYVIHPATGRAGWITPDRRYLLIEQTRRGARSRRRTYRLVDYAGRRTLRATPDGPDVAAVEVLTRIAACQLIADADKTRARRLTLERPRQGDVVIVTTLRIHDDRKLHDEVRVGRIAAIRGGKPHQVHLAGDPVPTTLHDDHLVRRLPPRTLRSPRTAIRAVAEQHPEPFDSVSAALAFLDPYARLPLS